MPDFQAAVNQNPEQKARDQIDANLIQAGWLIQDKSRVNLFACTGDADRENLTDIGLANYVLSVELKPLLSKERQIEHLKKNQQIIILSANEKQIFFDPLGYYALQSLKTTNRLPDAMLSEIINTKNYELWQIIK